MDSHLNRSSLTSCHLCQRNAACRLVGADGLSCSPSVHSCQAGPGRRYSLLHHCLVRGDTYQTVNEATIIQGLVWRLTAKCHGSTMLPATMRSMAPKRELKRKIPAWMTVGERRRLAGPSRDTDLSEDHDSIPAEHIRTRIRGRGRYS